MANEMESIIRSVGEWGIACRKRKSKSQHPTSQKAQSKSAAGCCWRRRHSIGSLSLLDIAFCPFADEFLVKTMSIYARAGAHTTPRHATSTAKTTTTCAQNTHDRRAKLPYFFISWFFLSSQCVPIGVLLLAIMWPLTGPRADKGSRRAQTIATAPSKASRSLHTWYSSRANSTTLKLVFPLAYIEA